MKTFDVLTTIAGSKLVVYPGGHLARTMDNYHYDPAYIDVREVSAVHDRIEVVCGGHVTHHVTVLRKQAPEKIVEMMKELTMAMKTIKVSEATNAQLDRSILEPTHCPFCGGDNVVFANGDTLRSESNPDVLMDLDEHQCHSESCGRSFWS